VGASILDGAKQINLIQQNTVGKNKNYTLVKYESGGLRAKAIPQLENT